MSEQKKDYSKYNNRTGAAGEISIPLWKKKSKPTDKNPQGIVYYSGSSATHWFSLFLNNKKQADSPDCNLLIKKKDLSRTTVASDSLPAKRGHTDQAVQAEEKFLDLAQSQKAEVIQEDDDQIPF